MERDIASVEDVVRAKRTRLTSDVGSSFVGRFIPGSSGAIGVEPAGHLFDEVHEFILGR